MVRKVSTAKNDLEVFDDISYHVEEVAVVKKKEGGGGGGLRDLTSAMEEEEPFLDVPP